MWILMSLTLAPWALSTASAGECQDDPEKCFVKAGEPAPITGYMLTLEQILQLDTDGKEREKLRELVLDFEVLIGGYEVKLDECIALGKECKEQRDAFEAELVLTEEELAKSQEANASSWSTGEVVAAVVATVVVTSVVVGVSVKLSF